MVVEGNTDVIALRQAGFEPVVAAMGTALTEQHLRELARLTKRLYLCFDADAAGEDATLRGMERAYAQGFEIRIVVLPEGQDPADAPEGFENRLGSGRELPPLSRQARDRAGVRPAGGVRPCPRGARRGGGFTGAPGRAPAPRPTASTFRARRCRGSRRHAAGLRRASAPQPRKLLDAGDQARARGARRRRRAS